jgi:hypothetical protein
MALVDRAKNIIVTPQTEWPKIAEEPATAQSIFTGYVLILAAIGPIAMAISLLVHGFVGGIAAAALAYAISLAVVFIVAWIADALAPSFGGEKDFVGAMKLVAYASTAAWVAGVFRLIPYLGGILGLIAAIYALYTFYLGAPVLKKCTTEKAVGYTLVVIVCIIVLWVLLGVVMVGAMFGGMATMGGAGMWR